MADQEYFIGSVGPLYYDDTDTYPDAVSHRGIRVPQAYIEDAPAHANEAARLGDLPIVAGHTGAIAVITNARINAGALEIKTTVFTFANGLLSSVGAESGWVATPI